MTALWQGWQKPPRKMVYTWSLSALAKQTSPSCILVVSIVLCFQQPKKRRGGEGYNHIILSSNSVLGEPCDNVYKYQSFFVEVSNDHPLSSLFLTHRNMWHLLPRGYFSSWSPVCGYHPPKGLSTCGSTCVHHLGCLLSSDSLMVGMPWGLRSI